MYSAIVFEWMSVSNLSWCNNIEGKISRLWLVNFSAIHQGCKNLYKTVQKKPGVQIFLTKQTNVVGEIW